MDDLNTPGLLSSLHEIASAAQRSDDARDRLYDSLVFLGLIPDGFEIANTVVEKIRAKTGISATGNLAEISAHAPVIESHLHEYFLNLPQSSNTSAIIATASIIFTGTPASYDFVNEWTKHNPYYISPRDKEHVTNVIGIKNLNEDIERRLMARNEKRFSESDQIRQRLADLKISLNDGKDPKTGGVVTTWEVVR